MVFSKNPRWNVKKSFERMFTVEILLHRYVIMFVYAIISGKKINTCFGTWFQNVAEIKCHTLLFKDHVFRAP